MVSLTHLLLARRSHRLLKRSSKNLVDVYKDSPCLNRAEMLGGAASKIPSGEHFDSRNAVEPENVSDIDIRKYSSNWGPILGC